MRDLLLTMIMAELGSLDLCLGLTDFTDAMSFPQKSFGTLFNWSGDHLGSLITFV